MKIYETSATVESRGQVHIDGVPFAPGTPVEVLIREKIATDEHGPLVRPEERRLSMRELFARVRAGNTETVGPLRREELYDRKVLR